MTDSVQLTVPPKVLHLDALPIGARLGEFEIIRLLGVGGFGMVYQAYDHSLHRPVAIKEYMPTGLAGRATGTSVSIRSSLDGASYQAGLQSFVAEARLLAQFDHPSLVKVFRFWEENNTAYMVMPLYTGLTLKQARSQMRSPPSEAWLRQVLWSVLEALKLLHAQDTVHRDVAPDNIFLQDSGPPVLLDLGAARQAISDLNRRHTAVLKVNYAPIEQYADARDMAQGPWSDLYSLAAVVHGCLANDLPLPATFRVLRDRMPSMQEVAQLAQTEHGRVYSSAFVKTLDRSLAIRPEQRPQSVQAFADGLDLQTPLDMAQFDWRAEMGSGWQLSREEQARRARPGPIDLAELPTQFVYTPRHSVEVLDEHPGGALAVQDGVASRRFRRKQALALAASMLAALGLGAAAMWGLRSEAPSMAEVPANVLVKAPVVMALQALDEPVKLEIVAEPVSTPPALASSVKPVASSKKLVPAPGKQASAKDAQTEPPQPSLPTLASTELVAQHRVGKSANVSAQLCADSNFFTRPMCIYLECQKPAFAALPACVENTQRLQAQQQRR